MKSYLSSDYTCSARTRSVQGDWHEIITGIIRVARVFEENGDTREAAQLYAYHNTLNQHAARHLERVAIGQNGHSKGSTPETEQGQAPAFEIGAFEDCSHGEADSPVESPVAAVPSDVESRIQTAIAVLDDLMGKHPDNQGYEVALKMLHRGRSLAREGKFELAERQLRAAFNAAHEAKEQSL
jgi:hypothetical protein